MNKQITIMKIFINLFKQYFCFIDDYGCMKAFTYAQCGRGGE